MLLPPSRLIHALIESAWTKEAPTVDLEKVFAEEPGLATVLLRFAADRNSNAGRELLDPLRASLLVGTITLGHLALIYALEASLTGAKINDQQRMHLWEDCVHRGAAATLLAQRYSSEVNADAALGLGVCLEFGRVSMMEAFPDQAHKFEQIRRLTGTERLEAEEEAFRTNHVQAFLDATSSWHLPKPLTEALAHHLELPADIAKIDSWRLCSIARWACMAAEVLTVVDTEEALKSAVSRLVQEAAIGERVARSLVEKVALESVHTAQLLGVDIPPQVTLDVRIRRAAGRNHPETMAHDDLLVYARQLLAESEQLEAEVQGLRVELHTLREFDALTGLPNRGRFMAALRKELGRARRYNRPLSVVLVDLDSFTELNARFGQEACDKFLQSTARTLDRVMRDVDFLARIGGDEFAVLLPETNRTGGAIVAERTRAAIEAIRMDVNDQIVGLSATVVGVSLEDIPASAGQDEMHGAATRQLRRLHNRGGNRASWVDGKGTRS
jgi:diguanylate cyclase (GGDEF)-like protein